MRLLFLSVCLVLGIVAAVSTEDFCYVCEDCPSVTADTTKTISCDEAKPTVEPTVPSIEGPTSGPSAAPINPPTAAPTAEPTSGPTVKPTAEPTEPTTAEPIPTPAAAPTESPTVAPTAAPTETPPVASTEAATPTPTDPSTAASTVAPTAVPTEAPTTLAPTDPSPSAPTVAPTTPSTAAPTEAPTSTPPSSPTETPIANPSTLSTEAPPSLPTDSPTAAPPPSPTEAQTQAPPSNFPGTASDSTAASSELSNAEFQHVEIVPVPSRIQAAVPQVFRVRRWARTTEQKCRCYTIKVIDGKTIKVNRGPISAENEAEACKILKDKQKGIEDCVVCEGNKCNDKEVKNSSASLQLSFVTVLIVTATGFLLK